MPDLLDGATRLSVIVGHPIAQVKAPAGLTRRMAARGINHVVVPAHVLPEDLDGFLRGADLLRNLDGIVVTVPHKFAVRAHCAALTPRAAFLGVVNVMRRLPDGGWEGDNTDGNGFVSGLREDGFEPAGKRALVVGAGGAGSAIAYELLAEGAAQLRIHDTDAARRDALVARLAGAFPGRVEAAPPDPAGQDLAVNATPLGMRAVDPLPLSAERLEPATFVAEVVTQPVMTPLLVAARARGCPVRTGIGMFEAQADLLVEFLLGAARREPDGAGAQV